MVPSGFAFLASHAAAFLRASRDSSPPASSSEQRTSGVSAVPSLNVAYTSDRHAPSVDCCATRYCTPPARPFWAGGPAGGSGGGGTATEQPRRAARRNGSV